MKITKIEFQKKNKDRLNIYVDNAFAFGLSIDVFIKHNLKKDQEVDNEYIEGILLEEENNSAINHGLKYLSFRQRSVKEMNNHLKKKGYDDSIINRTIDYLLEKTI